MHKDFDIHLKDISKIEGQTDLDISVKNGKVTSCKLKINQNKRFYTQAVLGKRYHEVPQIFSRICGTCSSAHALCSIEAIEKGLNITISNQTFKLKQLLINASHLRDHAMHLYFFCLPDIFGYDSVLDFSEELKEWTHDGLHVKEAGNFLSTIIGGRAVHPPFAVVAGFLEIPSKEDITTAIKKLLDARKRVLKLIEIFSTQKEKFIRQTNYVALVNENYNLLKGSIKTSKGTYIPEEEYGKHFERVILPYSTATAFTWESQDFMVGALSRMNLNKKSLHTNTQNDAKKYINLFPSNNIFYNNLAQSIEMLNEIDSSLEILNSTNFVKEEPQKPKNLEKSSTGIGVIEAPRGTLYYKFDFEPEGIIKFADLCIPTQQNIILMEKDIASYIELIITLPKDKISYEVEKLIRAYDPCMSCATHFLKINWDE